jgi:hypothetical protein
MSMDQQERATTPAAEDIKKKRLYLLRNDRGSRAHSKLIRQLKTLSLRIREGVPRWREAFHDHADRTGKSAAETTSLQLDFECYIDVLSRFFRLCADATGLQEITQEPIVRRIRLARNRIIEHGYELNRDGDGSFYCGENGPQLISFKGDVGCPSFAEIEKEVAPLIDTYGLSEWGFQCRQMAVRGPRLWRETDDGEPPPWPRGTDPHA